MRNALLLFVSALLLFAAGSTWLALYPTVPADLAGVENLDGRAERVRIPVGEDDAIEGWWLRGREPATVILFAGYARDHRRMWRYGRFLHARGLGVLAVDFRSARPDDRKPTTLGYWELDDARATLDWVRHQPELRDQRIALFGESLGGAVALTLAAERPDVDAVVADCPFASADAAIADGFRFVAHVPAFPLTGVARHLASALTGHDPGRLDVTESLRALHDRPVLVIQTQREDRFSREQVARIRRSLGLRAESWTLDDVNHTEAWIHHRDEYERRVGGFLGAALGVSPVAPPSAGHVAPGSRGGPGRRTRTSDGRTPAVRAQGGR
jgi:fermentation-respiration switch protein FrsA (DUF1100 family)